MHWANRLCVYHIPRTINLNLIMSATVNTNQLTANWFDRNMSSYYGNSHCGAKTIVNSSYLNDWIFYINKISLYWSPQRHTRVSHRVQLDPFSLASFNPIVIDASQMLSSFETFNRTARPFVTSNTWSKYHMVHISVYCSELLPKRP